MAIPNRGPHPRYVPQRPLDGKTSQEVLDTKTAGEPASRAFHSPIIGSCSSQNTCAAEACAAPALRTA